MANWMWGGDGVWLQMGDDRLELGEGGVGAATADALDNALMLGGVLCRGGGLHSRRRRRGSMERRGISGSLPKQRWLRVESIVCVDGEKRNWLKVSTGALHDVSASVK